MILRLLHLGENSNPSIQLPKTLANNNEKADEKYFVDNFFMKVAA
jgi:hypothetical protein